MITRCNQESIGAEILTDKMIKLRTITAGLLTIACLTLVPVSNADPVDLPVYKGELSLFVPNEQTRDSLVISYRAKTREVVRFGIDDLSLTNLRTKQVMDLPSRFARLENRIDDEGYWIMDVAYGGLHLGQDEYRIKGRLSLYLIGSQRTSNFSAYLEAPAGTRLEDNQ